MAVTFVNRDYSGNFNIIRNNTCWNQEINNMG